MSLAIVVPVKSPRRAKQRLESVLTEDERARLAMTMARDVFAIVGRFKDYGRFAISDDPLMLAAAREFGIEPLEDRLGHGQSAAVHQGFAAAWDRGYTSAATIPGDVPAVTMSELKVLCEYRPELEVLLAPDRERQGTNGLRLTPPHAITLRFGEDSFPLHRAEAARANRSFETKELRGLACDLDRPDDVTAFWELGHGTGTLHLLEELKVFDRVVALTPHRG